ncbi:MAG: class A beta-lactamase-related serine hydrolase [Oligoflexia bacterium]|nr:class A beta-lactamase-related serine hydrolase [Oligoflexia bacterium]
MDQVTTLVPKRISAGLRLAGVLAILVLGVSPIRAHETQPWPKALRRKLEAMDRSSLNGGRFGLYVKDLESGEELSYRGDERWYIASGVKVPIALEVLRQADRDELSLDDRIVLRADDYVDGAGGTNSHSPGAALSIRYLLEQMLIHSDNTASDLLLREAGLARVNALVQEEVGTGFSRITRLGDVRRLIYSRIFAGASSLSGAQLLSLKALPTDRQRVWKLGAFLGHASAPSNGGLDRAYAGYYASGLNSATLRAYGALLEKVWQGGVLGRASRDGLLKLMERSETGKNRVKAGLPSTWLFAHKTGTQRRRSCDFGILRDRERPDRKPVVIGACTEDYPNERQGEAVLKAIGRALAVVGPLAPGQAT